MGFSYPIQNTTLVRTGSERATLVRRTYALVLASIFVTMFGTWVALSNPAVLGLVARHPILTTLASFVPLWFAQRARTVFPANIGFTFLFTFLMGMMISPAIYVYGRANPGIISQAALLTGSTFAVLTLYAWVSRRDFSAWGAFFAVGLWVLIGTSLLTFFFQSALPSLWIAGATVLVFSGLLVFDTWRIRNQFGPDQYVQAAVTIYLDLLNLFIAILHLLGGGRRE